jgi:predicted DNA binding CopG/RHH family protein
VKSLDWNDLKNELLKAGRSVCFEDVQTAIDEQRVLDDIPHPNRKKYPRQRILIVNINNYEYLVPYVEDETKIFLKTMIPNHKATEYTYDRRRKMGNYDHNLDEYEQEVVEEFERSLEAGTLKGVSNLAKRKKELQQIARHTLNKTRNINIRLTERDLYRLKAKAIEEGIPYQTLASSILHKAAAK